MFAKLLVSWLKIDFFRRNQFYAFNDYIIIPISYLETSKVFDIGFPRYRYKYKIGVSGKDVIPLIVFGKVFKMINKKIGANCPVI